MPLFTKNGSIPKPQTDGTDGWILVPDKPSCPEGKEVVWLNWEWVIRDPKPTDTEGYQWNWNHGDKAWVECAVAAVEQGETQSSTSAPPASLTTSQISGLTTV